MAQNKKGKGWQQLFGGPPEKKSISERKRPAFNESAMIRGCVKWFRMQYHGKHIIKIDNEGKRSAYLGALKKAEGLTPGACDLFIPAPVTRMPSMHDTMESHITQMSEHRVIGHVTIYHGMWLEGKFGSNDLTGNQIAFQKDMQSLGYYVGTFYDLDEFINHCNIYFGTNYKSNKWMK